MGCYIIIFMKIILLFLITIALNAQLINFDIKPKHMKSKKFMNIKILDSVKLKFDAIDDIKFNEISALAYEKDKLYALSNKGYLHYLKIKIKKNKISRLTLKKSTALKKKKSKSRLKKKHRDAEGMVLVDNELYISFERKARVDVFSLNGVKIKKYKIPKELKYMGNYQTKNKALESIAYNEKYGILIAPEQPLIGSAEALHVIYAKDNRYSFTASSSLSAMEFIDEDRLLTLERSFNQLTRKRVIVLKEVSLNKVKNNIAHSKILAVLDSSRGWRLDNFEGLTKVGKNKFLMISDDNRSFFQNTLLVLFKVVD